MIIVGFKANVSRDRTPIAFGLFVVTRILISSHNQDYHNPADNAIFPWEKNASPENLPLHWKKLKKKLRLKRSSKKPRTEESCYKSNDLGVV